jgi:hypothetical protein
MSAADTAPHDVTLPDATMHVVLPTAPVPATIAGTRLCMKGKSASFVRHVDIDITGTPLEGSFRAGQSFGVVPEGTDSFGEAAQGPALLPRQPDVGRGWPRQGDRDDPEAGARRARAADAEGRPERPLALRGRVQQLPLRPQGRRQRQGLRPEREAVPPADRSERPRLPLHGDGNGHRPLPRLRDGTPPGAARRLAGPRPVGSVARARSIS